MEYTNRKIIVFLLLFTSFSWINSSGQDNVDMQIKEIKMECDRINIDTSKLKIVQKDIFDQSTEGGFLRRYYDGSILRKAILTLYGETGQSTSEYYFLNGELIFVNERGIKYKSPIYLGKTEIKSREENKFYFQNQKLIQWKGNDGKIVSGELYPSKEKEVLGNLKIIH